MGGYHCVNCWYCENTKCYFIIKKLLLWINTYQISIIYFHNFQYSNYSFSGRSLCLVFNEQTFPRGMCSYKVKLIWFCYYNMFGTIFVLFHFGPMIKQFFFQINLHRFSPLNVEFNWTFFLIVYFLIGEGAPLHYLVTPWSGSDFFQC
jgi:hypothetical protein